VSPIACIQYKGELILPTDGVGDLTKQIYNEITSIQYGEVEGHEWSVKIP